MSNGSLIKIIESGKIMGSIAAGGNILSDSSKRWAPNIHRNRLVLVRAADGRGHTFRVNSNSKDSLTFITNAIEAIPPGSTYEIMSDPAAELEEALASLGSSITSAIGSAAGVEKASVHNQAVGAGVDILGAALAPSDAPCTFRVHVAFDDQGCVFSAAITRGGNTQVVDFNQGIALTAEAIYGFDLLVNAGDTVNFRSSAACNCMVMRVQEF